MNFSEKLLSIPIVIPDNIANCGEKIEDEDSEEDTFMNLVYMLGPKSNISRDYYEYPDDYADGGGNSGSNNGEKVIYLQPFSLFFLSFYIILIITQFICMLWHR